MNLVGAIDPLYVLSGFCVGVLVGMTGVGGGSLMTPVLILLFGVHPTTAVGTDLLFAASTKMVGTLVHGATKTVDWSLVGLLAIGSVPATTATLIVLSQFDLKGATAQHLVALSLGAMLMFTAAFLLAGRTIRARYAARLANLGRRRGHRRHGTVDVASKNADGPRRWIRHCPCGTADLAGRRRPLVAWLDRLGLAIDLADRIAARHRPWQLSGGAHQRRHRPRNAGARLDHRRAQADGLTVAAGPPWPQQHPKFAVAGGMFSDSMESENTPGLLCCRIFLRENRYPFFRKMP